MCPVVLSPTTQKPCSSSENSLGFVEGLRLQAVLCHKAASRGPKDRDLAMMSKINECIL